MPTPIHEMKEITRRFVIEPWQNGNLDVLDEVCSPDYRLGTDGSLQDLKNGIQKTRESFSDLTVTMGDMVAEGNLVAYRWTMKGIFENAYDNTPPTGKPVTLTGITIVRFENGKIVEDQFESSSIGFEVQPA